MKTPGRPPTLRKAKPGGGRTGFAEQNGPKGSTDARGDQRHPCGHADFKGRPELCGFQASRRPCCCSSPEAAGLEAVHGTCPFLSPAPSLLPSWLEKDRMAARRRRRPGSCFSLSSWQGLHCEQGGQLSWQVGGQAPRGAGWGGRRAG